MSAFSGLNKLKDALDDVIHDDHKEAPTGHSKTQTEARSGEERKEHEIQKKSGWSDRVSREIDRWTLILIANDLDQRCPRWR